MLLSCKSKSFDQPHIFYRKLDTDKTFLKKNGSHSFKSKTIINVKFQKQNEVCNTTFVVIRIMTIKNSVLIDG